MTIKIHLVCGFYGLGQIRSPKTKIYKDMAHHKFKLFETEIKMSTICRFYSEVASLQLRFLHKGIKSCTATACCAHNNTNLMSCPNI